MFLCFYRDEEKCTALMLAADRGYVSVMRTLLSNGADMNAVNKTLVKNKDLWFFKSCV